MRVILRDDILLARDRRAALWADAAGVAGEVEAAGGAAVRVALDIRAAPQQPATVSPSYSLLANNFLSLNAIRSARISHRITGKANKNDKVIASTTPAPVATSSAAALGLSLFGTAANDVDKMSQMSNQNYAAPPAPGI
jgi:hypothetical protein